MSTPIRTPPRGDAVRVWLRDEWSCSWAPVQSEARRRGIEDSILHVHLPKKSAQELRKHLVSVEAARRVLDLRGIPASKEGQEARESMKSRLAGAEAARNEIVQTIVRSARVVQGGGSEVYGDDLRSKLQKGGEASLARLFPRFPEGDHRAWRAAFNRARDGSGQPFAVVAWDNRVSEHPVSKGVFGTVGTGALGSQVRRVLEAAPYGWPRDAVDAALVALHRNGHLRAERNGQPIATEQLDQTAIAKAHFRPEKVRLTARERLALRGLFGRLDVRTKSGEEEVRALQYLDALKALAVRAGGPAPLPPVPDTRFVEDLSRLTGNEQLAAILKAKTEIEAAVERWVGLAERIERRQATWNLAVALCSHAEGTLEVASEARPELDAVKKERALLADTDHVSPSLSKLDGALRRELVDRHQQLEQAVAGAIDALAGDATWNKLDGGAQGAVLRQVGLERPARLAVETKDQLRTTLDVRNLAGWRSEIDAVPARLARALEAAANRLDEEGPPITYVTVHRGTLTNAEEVRNWVAEHEMKLLEAVQAGPVIVK